MSGFGNKSNTEQERQQLARLRAENNALRRANTKLTKERQAWFDALREMKAVRAADQAAVGFAEMLLRVTVERAVACVREQHGTGPADQLEALLHDMPFELRSPGKRLDALSVLAGLNELHKNERCIGDEHLDADREFRDALLALAVTPNELALLGYPAPAEPDTHHDDAGGGS